MKNKGITLIELIVGISILLILVLICLAPFIHISSRGEGHHSGYITAIDQRGYLFKNYVVYFKTENSSSQEDVYCINRGDSELIQKAKEVNRDRKLVTLTYRGVTGFGLGLCEGEQIKDIE